MKNQSSPNSGEPQGKTLRSQLKDLLSLQISNLKLPWYKKPQMIVTTVSTMAAVLSLSYLIYENNLSDQIEDLKREKLTLIKEEKVLGRTIDNSKEEVSDLSKRTKGLKVANELLELSNIELNKEKTGLSSELNSIGSELERVIFEKKEFESELWRRVVEETKIVIVASSRDERELSKVITERLFQQGFSRFSVDVVDEYSDEKAGFPKRSKAFSVNINRRGFRYGAEKIRELIGDVISEKINIEENNMIPPKYISFSFSRLP